MIIVTRMEVVKTHDKRYHPFEYPIYHTEIPVLGLWEDPEKEVFSKLMLKW